MVTFREAVADSARGALCAVIAINDDGARLFGRVPGLRSGADYFNFFAPLRAQLCNDDPDDTPVPEPPFEGGQCVGTNYTVTGVATIYPFANCEPIINNFSASFPGPIRGLVTRTNNPSGPLCVAGGNQVFLRYGPDSNIQESLVAGAGRGATFSITSVTPVGSGPNDCGDPPIVVPPPGPVTRPTTIIYNTNEGDEVTIEGDWTFSPFFSVGDLSIKVPFTLDLGGVEWSGNVEISPEFNLEISPRVNFGGSGQPDDPTGLPPAEPVVPPLPEPEEDDSAIIGVIIRSSPDGELRQTAILTNGMPTIYAPRLASCSFAIESSLTVAWTSDIDVKNRDCYIPCPVPTGAVGVSVTAMPGWTCTWTAVRGRPLT